MRWRSWLKFYRYVWGWENYLLLARTWQAARLVRGLVKTASPKLADAISAAPACYLASQPNWHLSDPHKIYLFAHWVTGLPITWGKCVQRSLIVYRLLNAYGIPARVQFGIRQGDTTQDGHAWVCLLNEKHQAFGEGENPLEKFLPIFTSTLPQS